MGRSCWQSGEQAGVKLNQPSQPVSVRFIAFGQCLRAEAGFLGEYKPLIG